MKKVPILFFIVFIIISCQQKETPLTAQHIVDQAIQTSCNGLCDHVKIDFTFRDRCYVSTRNKNNYTLERITSDSTGIVRDILSNDGFVRFKNDTLIQVPDSMATRYSNSVNSVHYFAQLPYGLNDAAVQKELLGESTIKGMPYYEVGVSFKQTGGGTDFQDKFVYWIHKENYTVDYLAYSYETNGGGIRFREAYNVRYVDGIRFADYNNFKPQSLEVDLANLDILFEKGELTLLSKIETESVGVVLPEIE
ncbi:MAG: deoxyribose-phosphate aldolase [Flavobacteriaceae bacterium]|nr:deoxyribose-phosphate aldolase [Flavobacteriaceae bacterium]